MRPVVLILVVLVVLMAIAFAMAWDYPYVQARLAPLTISALIIILSVVALIGELRSGRQSAAVTVKEQAKAEPGEWRRTLVEVGWVVGFLAAVLVLGFLVTVFSFSALYMWARGGRWSASVVFAAAISLALWLLSSVLLDLTLYPGLIFRLLRISS